MSSNQSIDKINKTLDASEKAVAGLKNMGGAFGTVVWVKDGVLYVTGLSGVQMGEMLHVVDADVTALVMQLEGDAVYAAVLEESVLIRPGSKVEKTEKQISINVSEKIIGRVVDPLGNPLDQGPMIKDGKQMLLEKLAPSVMDRQPVSTPVQTGILSIDALVPIGRGQRELIIGDRQTGKTTVAIDAIINQKDQNMVCVYVAIGQRDGKLAQVINTLAENGAMKYTVVVSASASSTAAMQYLAPYAGVAVAEYFMEKGIDCLVVYDDLSKHAVAFRELSLLLRRPPGREAYPGDVFYLHSRLLERAARLSPEKGGGSITALPIIETQAGDVSAYIPTNVISITDGQIFLESKLFYKGIKPAINVGISVSRVGGAAQTKIMKKISGQAKLVMAQYYDLAAFAQFASELDEESKKQLTRGERLVEVMKQKAGKPYELWQEAVVLWSAMNGYFDNVEASKVVVVLEELLVTIKTGAGGLVKEISDKKELTKDVEASIKQVVESFFASKKGE